MRFIVGLDLRPQGAGAIQMVRWLSGHVGAPANQSFVGVHVVLRAGDTARDDALDEVCGRRVEQIDAALRAAGARDAFDRIEAVPGDDAAETLAAALRYHQADAILIGRQAPAQGRAVFRLGRCARRLVRALPAPVMVVPPDTERGDIGAGPVVVASDLTASSSRAAHVGLSMARDLSRDLVVLSTWRPAMTASPEWDALIEPFDAGDADPEAVERWLVAQRLGGAIGVREPGDPVEAMLRLGAERDAALLVSGSRRLGLARRVIVASTGTDLARTSPIPVLIVPPELAS
jgi:nucleotide-binding universal stress UspA family protein